MKSYRNRPYFFLAVVFSLLCARAFAQASPFFSTEITGYGPGQSSPVIAELDGDTTNGKEIAIVGADGRVFAVKSNGEILWTSNLPIVSCGSLSNSSKVYSSPAVGALYGDGVSYVVVGYGGIGAKACGGGVVAFHGPTGAQQWHFNIKAFDKKERVFSVSHSAFSTPALYDVDGDGKLEIGIGGLDRSIYLLTAYGKLRWYYTAADTVFSSPAFADANGDGKVEMVIGTDISKNTKLRPPTPNGGYLYALKTKKGRGYKIGFRQTGSAVWRTQFNQVIQSSPVVGEVVASNPGLEVVVGSGCYFPEGSSQKRGAWIKVLSLTTGRVLRTLAIQACSNSEAAIGDINGDGINEIVMPVNGTTSHGGDGIGRVSAWSAESGAKLWESIPQVRGSNDDRIGYFRGLVLADLDGNGSLEVVVTNDKGIAILSGFDGSALSCEESSCDNGKNSFSGFTALKNSVAVGDLDNDGTLDMVVAGNSSSGGLVRRWSNFASLIASNAGGLPPYSAPWPMFRGGATRMGR